MTELTRSEINGLRVGLKAKFPPEFTTHMPAAHAGIDALCDLALSALTAPAAGHAVAWRQWDNEHGWWVYYESEQPDSKPLFEHPSPAAEGADREYKVLEQLYASEINAKLEWQWDAGYEVALLQGFSNDEVVDVIYSHSFPEAMRLIAEGACKHYPESQFKRWWSDAPSPASQDGRAEG